MIADDHKLVGDTLRSSLEDEYDVLRVVEDGKSLIIAATELVPDLVLIDLGMPMLNGIDAGQSLKKQFPRMKFIVVTMNEDPSIASRALRTWAAGYLLKRSAGTELKKAIREVLSDRSYVTPSIAAKLVDHFIRDPHASANKALTERQRQVLQLLAEGRSMKEAASVLNVTTRTIAFHKYRIMEDFGLKNNADLVRFALRERLILNDE
jgi:DNA-binding NarL/FixJ family response regulator